MAAKSRLQKISIDHLVVGMHVVKLDIPWIESPFMRNSITIKASKDLSALRKAGVKQLVIDLDKGLAPEAKPASPANGAQQHSASPAAAKATIKQNAPTSMNEEIKAAEAIRGRVKKAVDNLQDALGKRLPIDESELTPLIEQTLGSLERNNQALMSLVHLSRAAQKIADHTFSVFCLALNIARRLNLSEQDKEMLGLASLLHEAGWSQMPMNLMGKRTAYSEVENKLLRKHPELSATLLSSMSFNEDLVRIVSEHHEIGDGSGYPKGLTLDELHPVSKILIVADNYDERINQLSDRPGMLPTNALRSLYVDAEKGLFDSNVVASFIDSLGVYPVSSAVQLSSGEKAVVVEVRADNHLAPVVQIHYDSKGGILNPPHREDLSEAPEQERKKISGVLDPNSASDDPARRLRMEV
jgi:putative nucleotidyltransferase with HDIG domain